jgi:hypothetical protein
MAGYPDVRRNEACGAVYSTRSFTKMKLLDYAVFAGFLFLSCKSPTSGDGGPCGSPSITGCNGDPCGYFYIYDSRNRLVNEASGAGLSSVYWNGTDCKGNPVPCGQYTTKLFIVSSGRTSAINGSILVAGANSPTSQGSAGCQALHDSCSGTFYQTTGQYIEGNSFITGPVCLCCKQ